MPRRDRRANFASSSRRASRGCGTVDSSHPAAAARPAAVVRHTVRGAPRRPGSVRAGARSPSSCSRSIARYTSGRWTVIAIDSASSPEIAAATPNPCRGSSSTNDRTICSSSDNPFSLIETMKITARAALARAWVASVALLLVPASPTAAEVRPGPAATPKGSITVSAASSLTEAFTDIVAAFRRANPGVRVRTNFGSTSALVAQIEAGAPADVFASADLASQDRLVRSGSVVAAPRIFARNAMQIAVKPGNPLGVRGLADLPRLGTVALCGRTAPCGSYAATLLARAGVDLPEGMVTRGADAKATLGAVSAGDADAAVVYATDVRAAGRSVTGVAISRGANVVAMYGISVVRGSSNRAAATAFVEFVLSQPGRRILASHGFLAP